MAKVTPNRNYPIPDENAVPPESGTEAFLFLQSALSAVDIDIQDILLALNTKSANGHHHQISDVEGLAGVLDGKMPASRTFRLDDLVDVAGADESPIGYVLVKTPDGWIAQSALAAVGNHNHSMDQVVGLSDALNLKQGTAGRGTANGYAPLDADAKVPTENLPSLTTTATVGAALAGANQKAIPSDSDRFSGILSGVSTVFWTTWGNIKSTLKAYFDTLYVSKAGDTITGQLVNTGTGVDGIKLKPSGTGGVGLNPGDATKPGYLSFIKADGTRLGYMGWADAAGNRIHMAVEGSMVGHRFSGDVWSTGNHYLNASATAYVQASDGNVFGSAWAGGPGLAQHIENRANAWGAAHFNNAVTNTQMAGNIEAALLTNQTQSTLDMHYGGYVCTRVFKIGQGQYGIAFGFRQPQRLIPNRGWEAAFGY